jgi:hypothetical protein
VISRAPRQVRQRGVADVLHQAVALLEAVAVEPGLSRHGARAPVCDRHPVADVERIGPLDRGGETAVLDRARLGCPEHVVEDGGVGKGLEHGHLHRPEPPFLDPALDHRVLADGAPHVGSELLRDLLQHR